MPKFTSSLVTTQKIRLEWEFDLQYNKFSILLLEQMIRDIKEFEQENGIELNYNTGIKTEPAGESLSRADSPKFVLDVSIETKKKPRRDDLTALVVEPPPGAFSIPQDEIMKAGVPDKMNPVQRPKIEQELLDAVNAGDLKKAREVQARINTGDHLDQINHPIDR
jgi:hypothetical protein